MLLLTTPNHAVPKKLEVRGGRKEIEREGRRRGNRIDLGHDTPKSAAE